MIRAITFDFWGTLFRDTDSARRHELRTRAVAEATGADPAHAGEALNVTAEVFARHHIDHQRTLTPADAVRLTCQTLRVTVSPETAERLAGILATAILQHPPVPIDGALDAVQAAARRVPTGIISDTGISPGASLRQLLDRHQFIPHLTALTFSDEVGVSKPQAPMFEHAAETLGVAPAELLHIGDLEPTDIAGIRRLGGTAALFAGVNTRFLGHTEAEYTFVTWTEFVQRLPELLDGS